MKTEDWVPILDLVAFVPRGSLFTLLARRSSVLGVSLVWSDSNSETVYGRPSAGARDYDSGNPVLEVITQSRAPTEGRPYRTDSSVPLSPLRLVVTHQRLIVQAIDLDRHWAEVCRQNEERRHRLIV